jgi:Amt family ammonium transporter
MVSMWLNVLSIFPLLCAADVQKSDVNSEEQMSITQRDQEALQLIRNIDLDLLKELVKAKKASSSASKTQHKRVQKRNRHGRKQRRLSRGRKLQDSNATEPVDPIAALQTSLDGLEIPDYGLVLDTMWLLVCGTFVFFMHAGFAMLEAGTGRAKNVQAILIKNLITVCMGTLGWYLLGWSLAYGGDVKTVDSWKDGTFEDCKEAENPLGCPDGYADNGLVGGSVMFAGSGFLGKGDAVDKAWAEGTIDPGSNPQPGEYMWFFQWAFCTAGASIVSGGIAERVKFPGYMFFSFCMTSFIYPVVVCSTWGYGWLETFQKDKDGNPVGGYIDFAGSGVVHLCGGIGALAGAAIVGKRTGRFDPDKEDEFQPHSQPLIVIGTFILWFGWCGFNPGSTLGMSDSGTAMMAAHVMMNTTLSAATGGVTVFLVTYAITKKYDCAALCNGILAGLVSITAGCSNVESGSAVLIGLLGGLIFVGSSALIKKIKIDDPVDASSVHGTCGIWGCLAAALFDFGAGTDKHHGWGGFSVTSWTEDGETKYMSTGDAIAVNMVEVCFVIAWSGGLCSLVFGILKAAKLLRVDEAAEEIGCDAECASPTAYNIKSPFSEPTKA